MGLDIYLYEYSRSLAEVEKIESDYEEANEKIWASYNKPYEQLTDEEKEKIKCRKETELVNLPNADDFRKSIREDSVKYPEHLFKMGYFRSSYNDGGINYILSDRLEGRDLYWIFNRDREDGYHFIPDWEEALQRAKQLLVDFDAALAKAGGNCRVIEVSSNLFGRHPESGDAVKSKSEALKLFQKYASEQRPGGFESFGNIDGEFFFGNEVPKLRALIMGQAEFSLLANQDRAACYAVVEYEFGFDFYKQALEVVIETCEWVLARKDQGKLYLLHWSG